MSPDEPTSAKPPTWAEVLPRVAGLWILAGCAAKALVGTPGDLPKVLLDLPVAVGTTFGLVLAIEAFVGLSTLVRPGRAWPLAALLLLAFAGVLGTQIAAGATSCGCFGATIKVPPLAMLAADVAMLAGLLVARPWRLAKGGVADVVVVALAMGAGVALPLLLDREAKPGDVAGGGPAPTDKWASLDFRSWEGKKVADLDLAKWVDLSNAQDGLWIFYRDSCEVCAACLQNVAIRELGAREITLVKIPERGAEAEQHVVHALPRGPFVHRLTLPTHVKWSSESPTKVIVENGVVTSARPNVGPEDCP